MISMKTVALMGGGGGGGGLIIHANIFEAVLLFILALVAVQITKSSSPNQ